MLNTISQWMNHGGGLGPFELIAIIFPFAFALIMMKMLLNYKKEMKAIEMGRSERAPENPRAPTDRYVCRHSNIQPFYFYRWLMSGLVCLGLGAAFTYALGPRAVVGPLLLGIGGAYTLYAIIVRIDERSSRSKSRKVVEETPEKAIVIPDKRSKHSPGTSGPSDQSTQDTSSQNDLN